MAEKLPRIVIIGAGASGISAASRLINNGLNNVRILEAENRIGGRIYSIKYGDSFVDLGAQSVADGSIVHDLSKNSDLLCQRTIPPRVYHSRSGPLSDSFAKTLLLKIYELYIQEKSPSISWKQHLVEKYVYLYNVPKIGMNSMAILKTNGQSWITNLLGLFTYSDNPNILSALFTGSLLPEIELTSEDILFDGIYYVTQKFFGKHFENITRPDGVKLFNWYSNPHFGGMTPAETIESKKEGLTGEILAQPLLSSDGKLQLLFAGEAANGFTYGSVNGAVIAGFREADRIIDICKNQK